MQCTYSYVGTGTLYIHMKVLVLGCLMFRYSATNPKCTVYKFENNSSNNPGSFLTDNFFLFCQLLVAGVIMTGDRETYLKVCA